MDEYDIRNDEHLYCDEDLEKTEMVFQLPPIPSPSDMFSCSCGEGLNLYISDKYIVCGTCGKVTPQY